MNPPLLESLKQNIVIWDKEHIATDDTELDLKR